jgi:hypothetical protein
MAAVGKGALMNENCTEASRRVIAEKRWTAQRLRDLAAFNILPFVTLIEMNLSERFPRFFNWPKPGEHWVGMAAFGLSVTIMLLMSKERREAEIALHVAYGMSEVDAAREVKSWGEDEDNRQLGKAIFRSPLGAEERPYLVAFRRVTVLEPVALLVFWVTTGVLWLWSLGSFGYGLPLCCLLFFGWLVVVHRLARKECDMAKRAIASVSA